MATQLVGGEGSGGGDGDPSAWSLLSPSPLAFFSSTVFDEASLKQRVCTETAGGNDLEAVGLPSGSCSALRSLILAL